MYRKLYLIFLLLLTACAAPVTPSITTASPQVATSSTSSQQIDLFTENNIVPAAPACDGMLTLSQTEGPYYKTGSPERNSNYQSGMPGKRLLVVGYVLDQNCQPIPSAWLDFWQADANGVYDNTGYTLRGYQYTDAQGRYFLETVFPGEYPGRTQHIHVKVQPPNGNILTSQLYFPNETGNSSDGIFDPSLVVKLEDRGDYFVAYFNFAVQK